MTRWFSWSYVDGMRSIRKRMTGECQSRRRDIRRNMMVECFSVRRNVIVVCFSVRQTVSRIYLFRFKGRNQNTNKSGDNSREDTPVPISNTEVKLLSADDTWREAAWESRTLPVFLLYERQIQPSTSLLSGKVRFPMIITALPQGRKP